MPKYLVLQPIWSRQHQAYFQPGDEVEFAPNPVIPEDLEPDPSLVIVDFAYLVKEGIMALIPPKKREVNNGSHSD